MFRKLIESPVTANACQVRLASAGVTCDMLMVYLVRRWLRSRSLPAAATRQEEQLESVKNTSWLDQNMGWALNKLQAQGLVQEPPRNLVKPLAAVLGLGCAAWGLRLSAANRRRKQNFQKKKHLDEKFVPLTSAEQDEPDAEPKRRSRWTSMLGTLGEAFRHDASSSPSETCETQGRPPKVAVKSLARKRLVKSTDDEPEDEDNVGSERAAVPGSRGFVGQQTAEVERVLQIFRMNTEGQVHLVDEEALQQRNQEREVVPSGLVRACTGQIENQLFHKDPAAKRLARSRTKG